MMKVILGLLLMFLMVYKNKMNFFLFNSLFLMSVLFTFNNSLMEIPVVMGLYLIIDYYSFMLILLSFWIVSLMLMTLFKDNLLKKNMFLFILLILIMFFSMKNMLLFYFFFELSLIPTFLMVVYWGFNFERVSAAYYMLMYTLMISLPLLIYIMMIYNMSCSFYFGLIKLKNLNLSFWGIFVVLGSFLIKMPMYLLHIWLPKAHVEAPVYGSMLLAGMLLKLGSYGLLQFLNLFGKSIKIFNNFIMSISLIGSLVVSLICLVQIDMKSLVAYSSVVHMNLMICSMMSLFKMGFISAYIIMIAHGLCSSGMFYMVNLYYERSLSRMMFLNKGMINILPSLSGWWFIFCAVNFSFPLSINFISEIYFLGIMILWDFYLLVYLILISFFSSAYSLYLYLYIQHGELNSNQNFKSSNVKEILGVIMHFFPLMIMLLNMILF